MAALLRCPLPPDPGYENTSNYFTSPSRCDTQPLGRVRPEAQDIARMHTMGTIAMLLSTQPQNRSSKYTSKPPRPVNHHRANKRRIKEIQIKTLQKKQQQSITLDTSLRPCTSNSRYSHVQPKVTTYSKPSTAPPLQPKLNLHASSPPSCLSPPLVVRHTPSHCVSSGDQIQCEGKHQSSEKRKKNFVIRNITDASHHNVKRQKSIIAVDKVKETREEKIAKHKRGIVPKYLCERKKHWEREEEERIAALPDPSIPEGHVAMPKKEKQDTLKLLQDCHDDLMKQLQALSLTADTLRVKQRKNELERKLAEIDDAIKIFCRPKVFVRINDDK